MDAYKPTMQEYLVQCDWSDVRNAVQVDFVDAVYFSLNGYWFAASAFESASSYVAPLPKLAPPSDEEGSASDGSEPSDLYESDYELQS